VQDVGIGQLGGEGRPGHVARQRRQGAISQRGGEALLGEVAVEHIADLAVAGAHADEQAVAGTDHLGKQVVLRLEMGIEGAAGQAGRQHDVVDVGAGIAAQPEQPGGVLEDLGPDAGGMAGAGRHDMSINIPYVYRHIIGPLQPSAPVTISLPCRSFAPIVPP
jgi:hypothetical protein